MKKIETLLRLAVVSLAMYFQLQSVKLLFGDTCLDRGGRFLSDKLMCEGEKGFISFNLAPAFYILVCIFYGLVTVGMLSARGAVD